MLYQEAIHKATRLYDSLYPSALVYKCVEHEVDFSDPTARLEASIFLRELATFLILDTLYDNTKFAESVRAEGLIDALVDYRNNAQSAVQLIAIGILSIPNFDVDYDEIAHAELTVEIGKFSLEQEPESMPQ